MKGGIFLTSDDGLTHEDALTHESGLTRCLARAATSQFAEKMVEFINDEVRREGNPATVIVAMMEFSMQTVASMSGQTLTDNGVQAIKQHLTGIIERDFVRHARQSREAVRRMGL